MRHEGLETLDAATKSKVIYTQKTTGPRERRPVAS